MNKKILLLLIFMLLIFITACQKITPITLETGDYSTYIEINSDELVEKLNNQDDFFLYISSVTCTSCAEFKPILDEVIAKNKVKIYKIEAGEFFKPDNHYICYQFTPTIVIIDNGQELIKIDAVDEAKTFESYEQFMKFYQKYIQ